MATFVIMPKQGQSVESCIITKWLKKEGDAVKAGEILFAYETDKASFEEEAKLDGVMLKLLAEEGDDVPCLENVCIIGEAGEDISSMLSSDAPKAEEKPAEEAKTETVEVKAAAPAVRESVAGVPVSPRARNTAARLGVDPTQAVPTGAEGRVIERDVLALAEALRKAPAPAVEEAPAAAPAVQAAAPVAAYVDKPLPNVRKVIAKAMMNSLQSTAQLTHTVSFDATEILAMRARCKASQDPDIAGITIGDLILYAVSRTLPAYESLNANLNGDTLRVFNDVNLGVAVDTPRGLLVPTVFAADKLSLVELSKAVKDLGNQAKAGTINPDMLKGGSFTVSNLGGFGVEHFTPVINAPQTGILGVCAPVDRVRQGKNGIELYKSISLCLTYDHRALDGAPATRFLVDLKKNLENFTFLLMK